MSSNYPTHPRTVTKVTVYMPIFIDYNHVIITIQTIFIYLCIISQGKNERLILKPERGEPYAWTISSPKSVALRLPDRIHISSHHHAPAGMRLANACHR